MEPKINIHEVTQAVKKALAELYGERLDRVLLYGSYARGDFHAESDVDFLVVLRDEKVNKYREIDFVGSTIFEIQLHFGVDISVFAMSLEQFQTSDFSYVKNVRRDGVLI